MPFGDWKGAGAVIKERMGKVVKPPGKKFMAGNHFKLTQPLSGSSIKETTPALRYTQKFEQPRIHTEITAMDRYPVIAASRNRGWCTCRIDGDKPSGWIRTIAFGPDSGVPNRTKNYFRIGRILRLSKEIADRTIMLRCNTIVARRKGLFRGMMVSAACMVMVCVRMQSSLPDVQVAISG